ISTWINSHPGGSVILYGVLGTDVTQDFFNEATDFDKDSFFPQKEAPLQPLHKSTFRTPAWTSLTPSIYSVASVDTLGVTLDKHSQIAKELRGNVFTTEDWEYVLKSRRIHGHSPQGMNKIANLLIGEIIPSPEALSKAATLSGAGEELNLYDAFEYRRYALTKKTLLTQPGTTKNPVYLMRFCLMFPHSDKRTGEPEDDFLPGQGVEIQGRSNDKNVFSRYFLTVRGNTTCMEIIVKCSSTGPMGLFMAGSKIGSKQFKIRGPFGAPLIPTNSVNSLQIKQAIPNVSKSRLRMMQGSKENFNRLIYIGAGIGIVPLLQILSDSILSTGKIRYAHNSYQAEIEDEMDLKAGDGVFIQHLYGDGWGFGTNTSTMKEGAFPASLLIPGCGIPPATGAKFLVVNCVHSLADIVGLQEFIPAILTYPDIIQVRHLVSSTICSDQGMAPPLVRGTIVEPIPATSQSDSDFESSHAQYWETHPDDAVRRFGGVVKFGRLNAKVIESLIGEEYDRMEQNAEMYGGAEVLVCGPNSFEQMVYESLVDEL
ncbi:hypothetical protein HK096_007963, partial [Nowakowskiella sp. JEL0078]